MRIAFLTSTPLSIHAGSGTFNGIDTLARALRDSGVEVDFFTPTRTFRVYTVQRLWFNRELSRLDFSRYDATVGFDLDGYRLRPGPPHLASIKGVIRDEARFEKGVTNFMLSRQAACEERHVRRADRVIVTSRYTAARVRELYGLNRDPSILPELIDLPRWQALLARQRIVPDPCTFTVLCVCRFYPRKRVGLLLEAAARLRPRIPELAVRIIGRGPEELRLHALSSALRLTGMVEWLGDVSNDQLAAEYRRADVFCMPSVQEGFGIVFLEAMAAAVPIVAARASSVPEVVTQGLLVEPESAEAVAEGIAQIHADPALRRKLAEEGRMRVAEFDAPGIAQRFLEEVKRALK